MALAFRGDGAGQCGDGLGQLNLGIAEVETYFLGADLNVLDSQAANRRGPLGIEEEKQPCEAVFGLEGVVVQEPACDVPAVLVVEWLSGGHSSGRRGTWTVVSLLVRAQRMKCPAVWR
ncbi:hypothetical protein [Streptomyces sp. 8N706]|uniref:hypothetical protein n=1 Tax=Streptomyces sp. 8N706 TaxID=3457416 RepID=UPI003FD4B770